MNRSWKKLPELNRGETRAGPITLEATNIHAGSSMVQGHAEPANGTKDVSDSLRKLSARDRNGG